MFYKLLSFILVYILSILNFIIILLPLWAIIVPMIIAGSNYIKSDSILTFILLLFFIVSSLMVLIMFFDFLFGLSVRSVVKGTTFYKKVKNYDILEKTFEDIKIHFNNQKVKLMISNSGEENAFAVGNMGRQYIIVTKGLVALYLMKLKNANNFLLAMKCILGHEMSHLINKDYLPGLLLEINKQAISFISKICFQIFQIIIRIIDTIPVLGRAIAFVITNIYNCIDFFINFFYKYIIMIFYNFIQLKISREREYRCDKQSSLVSGGNLMASTLSELGESGYMTIFSTHPKTKDRIEYVKNIKSSNEIIRPEFGNAIINFLSIIFIVSLPLIFYYFMNIKGLVENIDEIHQHILMKITFLKMKINLFFRR